MTLLNILPFEGKVESLLARATREDGFVKTKIGTLDLGFAGPDIDIELLLLAQRLWQRLGIENVELQIKELRRSR